MKKSNSYDEQFIIEIFQKYQTVKFEFDHKNSYENSYLKESVVTYANIETENYEKKEKYVKTIETILALMPKPEYTFLVKNYLNPTDNN